MSSEYHNKIDYSRFKVDGYPVRHKAKEPFLPRLTLDQDIRRMIRDIRMMDSELGNFILSEKDYLDLANEAYASNIHWSTKIEGNRLTLDEVREITTRYSSKRTEESPNGPVQEILNHLASMMSDDIFQMSWTLDTVRAVHHLLMKGVGQTEPGMIRTTDVSIMDLNRFEYFIPCPHQNVEKELKALIDWVNYSPFDEIVTATLFFHEFESIHPFEDGNGRTGRVLLQALLREYGLRNCGLCRFEEKLLSGTGTYYDLLAYTDRTENYTPLVMYVTESLYAAYAEAVSVFSEKDRLHDMEENTRTLAINAKKAGTFSFRDACGWVQLGAGSVRNKLDTLVDIGIIGKDGNTRAMRYMFLDPFREMKERERNDRDGTTPSPLKEVSIIHDTKA